jgi:hypothetical protein
MVDKHNNPVGPLPTQGFSPGVQIFALFLTASTAWGAINPDGDWVGAAIGGLVWSSFTWAYVQGGFTRGYVQDGNYRWIVAMGWMLIIMALFQFLIARDIAREANSPYEASIFSPEAIVGLIGIGIILYAKWSKVRHE